LENECDTPLEQIHALVEGEEMTGKDPNNDNVNALTSALSEMTDWRIAARTPLTQQLGKRRQVGRLPYNPKPIGVDSPYGTWQAFIRGLTRFCEAANISRR
jgi:hypothetical protein